MEESKEDPLVAKDVGFVCSLFMPGAARHLRTCLLSNGVIHDKKEDRMGFDPQMMEELGQSDLGNLFHGAGAYDPNRVADQCAQVTDWTIGYGRCPKDDDQ